MVILKLMKTAISIPDILFESAENVAQKIGVPRSQLYAMALEEFLEHHKRDVVTMKLNEIYGAASSTPLNDEAGLESLREATRYDAW